VSLHSKSKCLTISSIFAGASFSLQGHTISETVQLASGADFSVITLNTRIHLNDVSMKQYLNEEMARSDPIVLGYTCNTLLLFCILTVMDFSYNTAFKCL
jgi:hypothetical protein